MGGVAEAILGVLAVGLAPACGSDPPSGVADTTSTAPPGSGDGDDDGDVDGDGNTTTAPGTSGTSSAPQPDSSGGADDPVPPILFDLGVLPDAPRSPL